MKGIRTIIVLLVVVGFIAANGPCDALAGDVPEYALEENQQFKDDFLSSSGATDDDGSGDPGEAGDGYGVADHSNPLNQTESGGNPAKVFEDALYFMLKQVALLF